MPTLPLKGRVKGGLINHEECSLLAMTRFMDVSFSWKRHSSCFTLPSRGRVGGKAAGVG
jgi:hypothetical protein